MDNLRKSFLVRGNNIVGFSDKNFSTCPIGTVLSYAGQTAPHGYLICNGASYKVADYPDLYAVIGNTYGGDTENFNVPNLVDKFIQGSTTSGEEKEAGLPNITGIFYHDPNVKLSLSGAFSYTEGSSINLNDSTNKNSGYVNFDASKSNAIYGNSDTVQPPALTMVYIIKAFHTNEGVDSGVSDDVINYVEGEITEVETELNAKLGELSTYSTEETICGTWIDGKPIYRKVLTAEVLASDNVPNARLLVKLNIDATYISQFILIKGIIKVKGINKYVECGGSYYVGDEHQLSTTMAYDGKNILCVLKNGIVGVEWMVNKDLELKVIVEYTKVTD